MFVTQNMIALLTELKMNSAKTGNDTILGGGGDDEIDSGDGETDLETLQDNIKSHKDNFEDNDWI